MDRYKIWKHIKLNLILLCTDLGQPFFIQNRPYGLKRQTSVEMSFPWKFLPL